MKQSEAKIQRAIRLALGRLPDLVLFRNQVGVAQYGDSRFARYGLMVGASDLVGIMAPYGRWVAIEIKQPGEKLTHPQILFLKLIERMGGFAAVVHSVDEARAAIQQCRDSVMVR